MSRDDSNAWTRLEQWSATAFLIGGVMFILSAAVTVVDIAVGAEQLRLQVGQATVGVGWLAGLVGLLGLYPALADQNGWLVRVGAIFTTVGLVGYTIMTAGVLAIFAGMPEAALQPLEPVFLPLMLSGSVLPFPLFGVATLRTDGHPRVLGVLLVAQSVIFAVNAFTPSSAPLVLVALIGFILINFGIGSLLRSEPPTRGEIEPARDPRTG